MAKLDKYINPTLDYTKPILVWELEKGIVMSGIISSTMPMNEHEIQVAEHSLIMISANTGNPETDLPHGPYDLANVFQDTPGMRKALGKLTLAYDQARSLEFNKPRELAE